MSIRALCNAAALLIALWPGTLTAQTKILFIGADMYGGVVLPKDTDLGFAFGTRVGLLEVGGVKIRGGLVVDWWTAERPEIDADVRDIASGLDFWKDFHLTSWFRPFLGVGTALHSIDATRIDGTVSDELEPPQVEQLDGYRLGAAGFGGATLRLSSTGAIWTVLEYRYTAISDLPNHEVRLGLRLLIRGS